MTGTRAGGRSPVEGRRSRAGARRGRSSAGAAEESTERWVATLVWGREGLRPDPRQLHCRRPAGARPGGSRPAADHPVAARRTGSHSGGSRRDADRPIGIRPAATHRSRNRRPGPRSRGRRTGPPAAARSFAGHLGPDTGSGLQSGPRGGLQSGPPAAGRRSAGDRRDIRRAARNRPVARKAVARRISARRNAARRNAARRIAALPAAARRSGGRRGEAFRGRACARRRNRPRAYVDVQARLCPIVWFGCRSGSRGFGRARSRRGLLGAAPALAVARVFNLDAAVGKGSPEAVRARPILAGPSRSSLIEQPLRFGLQGVIGYRRDRQHPV